MSEAKIVLNDKLVLFKDKFSSPRIVLSILINAVKSCYTDDGDLMNRIIMLGLRSPRFKSDILSNKRGLPISEYSMENDIEIKVKWVYNIITRYVSNYKDKVIFITNLNNNKHFEVIIDKDSILNTEMLNKLDEAMSC